MGLRALKTYFALILLVTVSVIFLISKRYPLHVQNLVQVQSSVLGHGNQSPKNMPTNNQLYSQNGSTNRPTDSVQIENTTDLQVPFHQYVFASSPRGLPSDTPARPLPEEAAADTPHDARACTEYNQSRSSQLLLPSPLLP
jgi:hypothetical protein